MDDDNFTHIQYFKTDNSFLIVLPRYYFCSDIAHWYSSDVGGYFCDILTERSEKNIGIYMFHTENGDNSEQISNILNYMDSDDDNFMEPVYTFAQCLTCNRVGTVGSTSDKFNFIILFSLHATDMCHDCHFV